MRLKYRILWFEDNDSWFKTTSRNLNDFLEDHGFELQAFKYSNNYEGIKNILSKNDYDLILMDLKLDGVYGNDIIEEIRNEDIYTEIIFYSQSDVQEIRSTISEKGIDGLYCTSRNTDEFEDKVTKIIRNTIKKVQDVNNMRGLVIAETIDLENKIKNMLKLYFKTQPGMILDQPRSNLYKKICEKKTEHFKEEQKLFYEITEGDMESLIDKGILTSANLYHSLQSMVNDDLKGVNAKIQASLTSEERTSWEYRRQEISLLKEQLKTYDIEIIRLRNTLAHVDEKINEEGVPYLESLNKNGTSIIFDNEKYVEIRKILRKHMDNLSNIQICLFGDDGFQEMAAPAAI
ncbi:transcriptional regulator NarL [compost metagenome]